MTHPEPVFAARGLTKVYQMGEVTVEALRGIDFDLFAHELVVLLGPSGSGKSTLLNILGGLDVPTSGHVMFYAVRPGEFIPDRRGFGIFWMNRRALASAFDTEGGFNDVALSLGTGASSAEAIARLDELLDPYGGRGAIPRALQPSAWTLQDELAQLQNFGFVTPLIFLGVAAFILKVALTRALALQRPQIAALKALGYSNRELGWHYVKWGLVIAAAGAAAGVAAGAWLGSGMIALYKNYFRFPVLDYHLSSDVAAESVAGSLVVAALGAWTAVRRAVRIPPAEAMRPEAPARYRRSTFERPWRRARLTHATRMVLRNIERQPVRSLTSVVGIAFAAAVLVIGFAFIDVMNVLIDQQFVLTMRQDATVTFVEPRSSAAIADVCHLPGVMNIEPMRVAPVRFRAGHRTRTLAVTGPHTNPQLNRVVARDGRPVTLPAGGLVISRMLGDILDVAPGDQVQVEVLEGRRPVLAVRVAALVDDSVGLQAYMRLDALHRLMRESGVVSGAAVTVDPAALESFYGRVKRLPAIAGVALRGTTLQNFRETMAEEQRLRAALALAQADLKRARELDAAGLTTQQDVDAKATAARTAAEAVQAAAYAVASAEAELQRARARLAPTRVDGSGAVVEVRSPVHGVVVSDLLSTDAVRVKPGDRALIEQWGGDRVLDARVRRVEPSGFTKISALGVEERRVNVVLDFTDPASAWSAWATRTGSRCAS